MSTTLTPLSVARTDRRDALATRLFEANLATYDLATIYLGDRLGLYTALHERGLMTAAQLAAHTGTHERYIREWLEQQTVSGILEVEEAQVDAAARRYGIPAEHAEVLLERDSLSYLTPLGRFTIGVLSGLTKVLEAFKTGGGVGLSGLQRRCARRPGGGQPHRVCQSPGNAVVARDSRPPCSTPGRPARPRGGYGMRHRLVEPGNGTRLSQSRH